VLVTRHHTHAWKMLYVACTEVTSWWWIYSFETRRGFLYNKTN